MSRHGNRIEGVSRVGGKVMSFVAGSGVIDREGSNVFGICSRGKVSNWIAGL